MKSLVIIFSMFLALNVTAKTQMPEEDYFSINLDYVILENELFDLEQIVFEDFYNIVEDVKVSDINVVELEEDIEEIESIQSVLSDNIGFSLLLKRMRK